jgi:hypothetical protein
LPVELSAADFEETVKKETHVWAIKYACSRRELVCETARPQSRRPPRSCTGFTVACADRAASFCRRGRARAN